MLDLEKKKIKVFFKPEKRRFSFSKMSGASELDITMKRCKAAEKDMDQYINFSRATCANIVIIMLEFFKRNPDDENFKADLTSIITDMREFISTPSPFCLSSLIKIEICFRKYMPSFKEPKVVLDEDTLTPLMKMMAEICSISKEEALKMEPHDFIIKFHNSMKFRKEATSDN